MQSVIRMEITYMKQTVACCLVLVVRSSVESVGGNWKGKILVGIF